MKNPINTILLMMGMFALAFIAFAEVIYPRYQPQSEEAPAYEQSYSCIETPEEIELGDMLYLEPHGDTLVLSHKDSPTSLGSVRVVDRELEHKVNELIREQGLDYMTARKKAMWLLNY